MVKIEIQLLYTHITLKMKKCSEEMQTLHASCSKAVPKIFAHCRPLPGGAGRPKCNQHYLYLQTQFGEDRCTQIRVIVVTDPQTQPHTPREDRLQYTVPQLACSVTINVWYTYFSAAISFQKIFTPKWNFLKAKYNYWQLVIQTSSTAAPLIQVNI